jgi:hypothetical protein
MDHCSFCFAEISPDRSKSPAVAGADVFICRACIAICVCAVAKDDPKWREQQIKVLADLRGAAGGG